MSRPYNPPEPYGYRFAVMVALGQHHEAGKLLAALNQVQRGFGCPNYVMPVAAGSINGLETCRWDVVPLVEVERISDTRIAA